MHTVLSIGSTDQYSLGDRMRKNFCVSTMFRIYGSGDTVPEEVMAIDPLSDESLTPGVVEFTRPVVVYSFRGRYHILPIYGLWRVSSVYIDEIGACKIVGGGKGLSVHTVPAVGIHSILMVLAVYLITNIFS